MKYGFPFLALLLCLSFVHAQSSNATISGGVTDPFGNLIVDAEVEIANDATGIIYPATTNSSGMYLVPILPPGHYHVQVSKPGFKTIIKADVVLNVQTALALNFTLSVGATSESVTVGSTSASINSADASVSTVIDSKFVENTPLNGRSFQDLISMTPGVVTHSPQANSGIGAKGGLQCQWAENRVQLLYGRWSVREREPWKQEPWSRRKWNGWIVDGARYDSEPRFGRCAPGVQNHRFHLLC